MKVTGPWSITEKQLLCDMLAKGISRDVIARQIGRSKDAIRHQVSQLGVGKRRRLDVSPVRMPSGLRGTREVRTYLNPNDPGEAPLALRLGEKEPRDICREHLRDLVRAYPDDARKILARRG